MADYAGISEAEEIDKLYENYPDSREMIGMCFDLGIRIDSNRTIEEDDAWTYYHELKAKVEAKQRRSA
jgi:hypothetical protein